MKAPLRHETPEPTVSQRTVDLLQAYSDHVHARYGARTAPEYVAHARSFVGSRSAASISATRNVDLRTYQTLLAAMKKADGSLYSVGSRRTV